MELTVSSFKQKISHQDSAHKQVEVDKILMTNNRLSCKKSLSFHHGGSKIMKQGIYNMKRDNFFQHVIIKAYKGTSRYLRTEIACSRYT